METVAPSGDAGATALSIAAAIYGINLYDDAGKTMRGEQVKAKASERIKEIAEAAKQLYAAVKDSK